MLIDVGYRDALGNDRTDLESEIRKTNLDVNGNLIGVTDTSTVLLIVGSHLDNVYSSNKRRSSAPDVTR